LKSAPNHLPSLLSAILFSLSSLFLFGIGLLMAVTALLPLLTGEGVEVSQTIFFLTFSFEAVLLFAAAFFAFQKVLQKPSADEEAVVSVPPGRIVVLMLIAAGSILIGSLIGSIEPVNWLLLPILTIPVIVLPLGVIFALGARRLPLGARWQSWSVFGLGMTVVPFILLSLEAVLAIIVFIGVVAYVSAQPELANRLQALSQQIMILGPQSEATRDLLLPLFTKPGVIVTALIYIAVLVPAIEELFKPLGVWLFASKLDSPAQGFALGALSGAGYALIETIGVSGQGVGWASLLLSRIGTGVLHITTSALMGAAIVRVWNDRRYLRLLGTYLLAVTLHGLWNTFALLFTFSNLAELLDEPGWLKNLQPGIIVVMSILAVGLFAILLMSNRKLRGPDSPPSAAATPLADHPDETL